MTNENSQPYIWFFSILFPEEGPRWVRSLRYWGTSPTSGATSGRLRIAFSVHPRNIIIVRNHRKIYWIIHSLYIILSSSPFVLNINIPTWNLTSSEIVNTKNSVFSVLIKDLCTMWTDFRFIAAISNFSVPPFSTFLSANHIFVAYFVGCTSLHHPISFRQAPQETPS